MNIAKTILNTLTEKNKVATVSIQIDMPWNNRSEFERLISASIPGEILKPLIKALDNISTNQNDFFITYSKLLYELTFERKTENVICFGFRTSGVDSNSFIVSKIKYPEVYGNPYLDMYALEYRLTNASEFDKDIYEITLYNIKNDIKYDPADDTIF